MRIIIILLAVTITLSISACNDTFEEYQGEMFMKFFTTGVSSKANDVIEIPGEGYVLTGYDVIDDERQLLVVRTDLFGNEVFNMIYRNPGSEEEGRVMKQVSDGFLISGISTNEKTATFIMKVSNQGEFQWSRIINLDNADLIMKDFLVDGDNIYLTANKIQNNEQSKPFYARLALEGGAITDSTTHLRQAFASSIFKINNQIVVIGHNVQKELFISKFNANGILNPDMVANSVTDVELDDAILFNDQLFLLSSFSDTLRLIKMNVDYSVDWQSEVPTTISGKSMTLLSDESILVMGDRSQGDDFTTYPIRIYPGGSVDFGENHFKAIPGQPGNIISTADGGIIFSGCTNATYVQKARLVKTGSDLFLLKHLDI